MELLTCYASSNPSLYKIEFLTQYGLAGAICAGEDAFLPETKKYRCELQPNAECTRHKAQSHPKLQIPHALGTLNCKLIIRNVQATNLMEVLSRAVLKNCLQMPGTNLLRSRE